MKASIIIAVFFLIICQVQAGLYDNQPHLFWSTGTPDLDQNPSEWGISGYVVETDSLTGAGNTEAGSLHLNNEPGYFFYGESDYPANSYKIYTMKDAQNIYIGVRVWDEVIDNQGTGGRMDRSDFIQFRLDGNNCQVDYQPGLVTDEDWTANGWVNESSWGEWMQNNPSSARLFMGGVMHNGEWTTIPVANGETTQTNIWHTANTTTPNYTIGNNIEGDQINWGSETGIWSEGYWINCWWDIETLMNGDISNWESALGMNIVCKDVDGETLFANNDHNRQWLAGPLGTDGEIISNLFFGPGSAQTPPVSPEYQAVRWVCAQPRLWASVTDPPSYQNIVINEIMVSNAQICLDPDYKDFCDWIELYNGSDSPAIIGGLYLTDDLSQPTKWQIPAGTTIPADDYLLFWADDHDTGLHTSFKLSSENEAVGLANSQGEFIDQVEYEQIDTDVSFGRVAAGWRFFGEPTPGTANVGINLPFQEYSDEVTFSISPGFYNSSVAVSISAASPADIYYTTDGSYPWTTSFLYSQAIQIDSTTVLRARACQPGLLPGEVNSATFFIDEPQNLQAVSISLEPDYYWDDEIGIYPFGNGYDGVIWETANFYQDWERPANIEIFDFTTQIINQRAGIKISGGGPRKVDQRSMALYCKDKYADTDFDHEFFAWKSADSFTRLNLRNSGNDWEYTLLRDAMMQNIVHDRMDIDFLGYQPSEIFINGEYWGILNMREKADEYWVKSNYDLDPDDDEFDMIAMQDEILSGDMDHWNAFYSFLENNSLEDQQNFDYAATQMDIDEYMNYMLTEVYVGNTDWPGHNLKYWRPRTDDGKWRWLLFDLDFGFGLNQYNAGQPWLNTLEYVSNPYGTNHNPPWSTLIIRRLLENEYYVNEFSQRLITHIFTTFTPDRVIALIDEMEAALEPAINRHIELWGDTDTYHQHNSFATLQQWHDNVQVMRDYAIQRPDYVIGHVISKFSWINNFAAVNISVAEPACGTVMINNVQMTGAEYNGFNFTNIPLRIEAFPAQGYIFSGWEEMPEWADSLNFILDEPLTLTAHFEPAAAPQIPAIVINEFMADNLSTIMDNAAEFDDWIELYNFGNSTVDIAGLFISDDGQNLTKWQMPSGYPQTIIAPGQFLLLWADEDIEQGVLHLDIKLSANGEEIFLTCPNGYTTIDSIVFQTQITDMSYGRYPDASPDWDFMDQPTPGTANYFFDHIYGDVDDNGIVEAYDSSLILQYVVGLYPEDWLAWQNIIADVDLNNYIDAYDAAIILRYVTGMIDELPLTERIRKMYLPQNSRDNTY
ncbi:MAG: CotH kinase family protein [Candidatus Cloacimonetes bacterium]|nr:CotH kinase family protein [Candidatus Cloacimonadota bacterium]